LFNLSFFEKKSSAFPGNHYSILLVFKFCCHVNLSVVAFCMPKKYSRVITNFFQEKKPGNHSHSFDFKIFLQTTNPTTFANIGSFLSCKQYLLFCSYNFYSSLFQLQPIYNFVPNKHHFWQILINLLFIFQWFVWFQSI